VRASSTSDPGTGDAAARPAAVAARLAATALALALGGCAGVRDSGSASVPIRYDATVSRTEPGPHDGLG
jgi:hypothetical protein